jgi:glycosyltransferase involved in cell wall biosynthesis
VIRVLHLTAHLGGGVGRALSALCVAAAAAGRATRHDFVTLEAPEKRAFAERITGLGGAVHVQPSAARLAELLAAADVVQLEYWNHPATLAALCSLPEGLRMRLVVWSHVSGLHSPVVPAALVAAAHRFIFTSPCSPGASDRHPSVDVVASSGGFDHLPETRPREPVPGRPLRMGYAGTLSFSKLHPQYAELVAASVPRGAPVRLIGDEASREALEARARAVGRPDLFEFRGYREDVASELGALDVLLYFLNPRHYGTTENALLEAMALGVVPIVLDNPVERLIVRHGETGFVSRTGADVAACVARLATEPELLPRLGAAAAADVRSRFDPARTEAQLDRHYREVMALPPRHVPFRDVFGDTPAEWFRRTQEDPSTFGADGSVRVPESDDARASLVEPTKGSVHHFYRHFPGDPLLARWAAALGTRA